MADLQTESPRAMTYSHDVLGSGHFRWNADRLSAPVLTSISKVGNRHSIWLVPQVVRIGADFRGAPPRMFIHATSSPRLRQYYQVVSKLYRCQSFDRALPGTPQPHTFPNGVVRAPLGE